MFNYFTYKMYKVLFIENNYIIRLGLHQVLLENLPVNIWFHALPDHIESQEWLAKNRCNLVIIGSVKTNICQLVNQIKANDSQTRVLIFADMDYADALNILVTGVDGLIYQQTDVKEITLAVQTVLSGTDYWGRQLAEEMARETLREHIQRKNTVSFPQKEITLHKLLSKRQMDVVRALIRGESVPVIAVKLAVSPSTVATHKSIAFKKLGVNSIVELIENYYADNRYLGFQNL